MSNIAPAACAARVRAAELGLRSALEEQVRRRWLVQRIDKEGVLDRVAGHHLVHPVRHGAKVRLPPAELGPEATPRR